MKGLFLRGGFAVMVGWIFWIITHQKWELANENWLFFEYNSSLDGKSVVYFDRGQGFSEADRSQDLDIVATGTVFRSIRIPLKTGRLDSIRIDPVIEGSGSFRIRHLRLEDGNGWSRRQLGISQFVPNQDISLFTYDQDEISVSFANALDPNLTCRLPLDFRVPEQRLGEWWLVCFTLLSIGLVPLLYWGIHQITSLSYVHKVGSYLASGLDRANGIASRTYLFVLAGIIVAHRLLIFGVYIPAFTRYILDSDGEFLTYQYLTVDNMLHHYWKALLYLQQAPPLPQMILGAAMAAFGWPSGTHYAMSLIQGIITLIAAVLMFKTMEIWSKARMFHFLISLVYALSIDSVVMEYNWFGQTIYENLGMVWILGIILLSSRVLKHPDVYGIIGVGVMTGLLALTRTSFAYVFPLPILILGVGLWRKRSFVTVLALFVAGWAPLQIGWSLKNQWVYGYFSLGNSSWEGFNLLIGLKKAGHSREVMDYVHKHPEKWPEWFVEMHQDCMVPYFGADVMVKENLIPHWAKAMDAVVKQDLGGSFRVENSMSCKVVGDVYKQVYLGFIREHLDILISKAWVGWNGLWRPIREYPYLFIDPFYCKPMNRRGCDLYHGFESLWIHPEEETVYLSKYGVPRFQDSKCSLFTIDWLPRLIHLLNVVNVPVSLFVSVILLIRMLRTSDWNHQRLNWFMLLGLIAYLCIVVSVVENGREECRYRIPVEPAIWVLLAVNLEWLVRRIHLLWMDCGSEK